MIRKLKSGKYRLYAEKKDPKTSKRRNLCTFDTREAAKKHERQVQFFKRKKVNCHPEGTLFVTEGSPGDLS